MTQSELDVEVAALDEETEEEIIVELDNNCGEVEDIELVDAVNEGVVEELDGIADGELEEDLEIDDAEEDEA